MGKEKDPLVAALEGQLENMRGQLRVFEDWNKKLHDGAREERRRRELAEADAGLERHMDDAERLIAAFETAVNGHEPLLATPGATALRETVANG